MMLLLPSVPRLIQQKGPDQTLQKKDKLHKIAQSLISDRSHFLLDISYLPNIKGYVLMG